MEFKIGDKIRLANHEENSMYPRTNTDAVCEVIKYTPHEHTLHEHIKVKIIEHKHPNYIGEIWIVDPNHFKLNSINWRKRLGAD